MYKTLKERRDALEKTNLTSDDVKNALRKENSQYEAK
jgi:multidrug efflux pump subunit AcrB